MLLAKHVPYGLDWSSTYSCSSGSNLERVYTFGKALLSADLQRSPISYRSILTSIWGTMLFSAAELLAHYSNQEVAATVVLNVGWVAMVTGFSLVLYSRLHLLKPRENILRVVLACIIVDAILFHGPTIISTIIVNVRLTKTATDVYENISFTEIAFSVQETVLASMYIYFFLQYTVDSRREPETNTTLRMLVGAEFVVLSTDVVLNTLLYTKYYLPRVMIQALMSALKLKIEFVVLNSLVEYAQHKAHRQLSSISARQMETLGSSTNPAVTSSNGKDCEAAISEQQRGGHHGEMSWISSLARAPINLTSAVLPEVV
jgi:hypothetical protein